MPAGCRSCGGGGGVGGSIQIQKGIDSGAGAPPPGEPDMVLLEYVAEPTQFQTVRSKVNGARIYRYGGDVGSPERLFYVYAGDVPWMTSYPDFRIATLEPVMAQTVNTTAVSTLTVDRTPLPVEVVAPTKTEMAMSNIMPIETLSIDGEIVSILRKAGYETIGQIRDASVAELSSIKGMGPARLKKVQVALA